ncbi:MAG: hypothetical protein BroJett012_18860 [Betaproteobacteria bacterium]|nr:MAG: hypothetical protein BroJett012_18860 [Betaproteobacteria bacterium]
MLEKLRLIFSKSEPETVAGLLAARAELEAARAEAIEALRRAQIEKNGLLVEAVAAGDAKTRTAVRKSLAELQAEVDELGGALAGLDTRIEQARTAEAGQAAAAVQAERARLATERGQAASDMQHALEALCAAFVRFDRLGRKIEAAVTRREIERLGLGDFDLIAAIGAQLACRTGGRLGDMNTLRGYTIHEFQRAGLLVDLPELARRQNARLGLSHQSVAAKAA